ncbi:MAG: DUF1993 domain-containing protein [Alphaproteobacteria bacterium]|nr:DUF1993 domain-containing protein [Alphaproteobacteria bacterium]
MYDQTIPQLDKMLGNLDTWLGEASEWAEHRGFDADALLHARLFPDMFAFDRQVQSACDTAKLLGARLAGVDAPSHPDTEKTLGELRERVAKTRAFLASLPREAFDDAATKKVYLPFLQGGFVLGAEYVTAFALPNFYFHTTTAYALLRQAGVKLGKRAFIGGMNVQRDA